MRRTKAMVHGELLAFTDPLQDAMKRLWEDGIKPKTLFKSDGPTISMWKTAFGPVHIADLVKLWELAQRDLHANQKDAAA